MWDVFSHIPHMQKVLQLPGSTIRPLCHALTCVNSHQTTPNLMKNLNLNFPHECHNIYSVPLVIDDFTLNLAFIMSFTRFLSFFN